MSETAPKRIHEYEILIRESHLDFLGHVNNATYLTIFEEARWDLITARGFGVREVLESGLGPVILDVRLQFRRELRNREKVLIRTWTVSHAAKTASIRQVMINSRAEEACILDLTAGLFDLKTRKLVEPTPKWREVLAID